MAGHFRSWLIFIHLISASKAGEIFCEVDSQQCNFYHIQIEKYNDTEVINDVNENITKINFLFSRIHGIPLKIFERFPKLENLFVKSVGLVEIDFWLHDLQSLLNFEAEYNMVTILEQKAFLGTKNLEVINLRHNKIDTVKLDAFFGLENLKKLHLSYNKIHILEELVFQPLKSLASLHLNANKIETLHKDLFAGNLNLKVLHLESNRIITIFNGTFDHLNLKILYLNDNDCVESDIFVNPWKNLSLMNERLGNCFESHSLFWRGKIVSVTLEVLCFLNFICGVVAIIVILAKRRKKKRITMTRDPKRGISIIARPY
jgi:Leucine-rich repeat (LRR) protein